MASRPIRAPTEPRDRPTGAHETKLTAPGTPATWAHDGTSRRAPRAVLLVYGLDANTQVVEVPDGAQLTVGRSRHATVRVESERVSRIHAKITRRGDAILVEDAGSRNGTWRNGAQVVGQQALASGDEIVIGPIAIVVSVTSGY